MLLDTALQCVDISMIMMMWHLSWGNNYRMKNMANSVTVMVRVNWLFEDFVLAVSRSLWIFICAYRAFARLSLGSEFSAL